jgi:hypothetical protein
MVRLRHPTAENLHMLLALLARGDAAKDLELM